MYADLKSSAIRLLLRPKEAAEALAISPRTLWTLTRAGRIPVFRNERIVRYSVDDLRKWIEENKSGNGMLTERQ
jgi:excisionase family DNA binding protein